MPILEMVKVNITTEVPAGDYCDVCTSERIEVVREKVADGTIQEHRNLYKGQWEYRCGHVHYVNPKPICALFNIGLTETKHIPGDPIAERLVKCKKCKVVSAPGQGMEATP